MKITTNKATDPIKKKSGRVYASAADEKKQTAAEGKDTPFQNALRSAEGRSKKVFHWHDKKGVASDTPFEGSRPIATNYSSKSSEIDVKPVGKSPLKVGANDDKPKPKVGEGKVPMVQAKTPGMKAKAILEQSHKGSRAHGTVKNTLLRKIDNAINPDKYGATSNSGKNININRSSAHSSSKPKVKGYSVDMGDGKKVEVKKLKPKAILKEAKKKGYIS